jgi:hypothetical protein
MLVDILTTGFLSAIIASEIKYSATVALLNGDL